MPQRRFDHFLYQTQIAGHISGRDVGLRIVVATIMLGICFVGGFLGEGLAAFAVIIMFELVAYPLNKRASRFDQPLGLGTAVTIFAINWGSLFPFLSYGVILSQSDSLPFILAGFIWTFGVFVHISNTFGLLPVYNWTQMSVAIGAVFYIMWNLIQNPAHPDRIDHWLATLFLMLVYAINTFGTMTRQNDTHRALERARKEANTRLKELERLSRHDPLTGLLNRRAFDDKVETLMQQHAYRCGVTVFLIDLDGFKPINDSYSHNAGDAMLCAIAGRLTTWVGKDGLVARLGGDEFAVVRTDITGTEDAYQIGTDLIAAVTAPTIYEEKMLQVGASIGIARQTKDLANLPALLSGADQAMFRAKQEADCDIWVYDKDAFPVRASLEDRQILLAAMQTGEIVPYYQPKICLETTRVVGFEALSRWHHPTRGLLAPADFLPQINELGLQGEFTLHTVRRVLRDLQDITADGFDPGQVSVNIAEVTLATVSGHNDLLNLIDVYPHLRRHLTFEITEDIFIARSSEIIQRSISNFRKIGVRISLDDFGTGFASFQHLKELEFDELKLDTGFVRDLGIDTATHVLVEGLLTMAQGLGVQVVAEGVETQEQSKMLRDLGCRFVQGYLYGRPVPFADTLARLRRDDYRFVMPIQSRCG
ncbi:MAG: EAL domain-containing protein [Loktanella sp.]|nr:EAL domain-containing protein [Loktanella sp.]